MYLPVAPGNYLATSPVWHGDNSQFFWAENWEGIATDEKVMFVTNFNATVGAPGPNDDPLYSFNGTLWSEFHPVFLPDGSFVQTCRLIVAFKGRLLLLNTIENTAGDGLNHAYVNRCRFSRDGEPFPATAGVVSEAWLEPNSVWTIGPNTAKGVGAGWIDATTEEEIISSEFIKDRLIVYFEKSTWN